MIEDWTLGTLKRQIRLELGLQDNPQQNEEIVNKINLAQSWVVRRRPNWPWMKKEYILDVKDDKLGNADFTKGSKTVTFYSGTPVKRDIVIPSGASGDQTLGYLITNVVPYVQAPGMALSPAIWTTTIQSQFRSSDLGLADCRMQTGFMQLPKDFIRFDTSADLDSLSGDRIRWRLPKVFDEIKRLQPGPGLGNRYYTIKPDPLGEEKRMYIAFFPYISRLTTIQGDYYAMPDKLTIDSDTPAITVGDRDVLFYFSLWFMTTKVGSDQTVFYRDQALSELDRMTKEYALSEDIDDSEIADVDWVAPPASYPWWDEEQLVI
jgi:hypothetical protein